MKKAKLFTLLAALSVCLGASSCALPDILYPTVEGHQHTIVHYYNSYHHWDECTECGERLNVEDHTYGTEFTQTETTHTGTCSVCGYEMTEEHTFAYITDINDHTAYCIYCQYSKTESHTLVATPTTVLEYNEETDQYDEVEGHIFQCVCGYSDELFEDHYCDPDGYIADNDEHYKICDVCGYIYDRGDHSHANDATYSLTNGIYDEDDESGYYGYYTLTYTCEVCGKDYTELYNLSEEDYKGYFEKD